MLLRIFLCAPRPFDGAFYFAGVSHKRRTCYSHSPLRVPANWPLLFCSGHLHKVRSHMLCVAVSAPMAKLENYLETYRKRTALSQKEVAFLLGAQSGAKVCRYERFWEHPQFKTLMAYQTLSPVPVRHL